MPKQVPCSQPLAVLAMLHGCKRRAAARAGYSALYCMFAHKSRECKAHASLMLLQGSMLHCLRGTSCRESFQYLGCNALYLLQSGLSLLIQLMLCLTGLNMGLQLSRCLLMAIYCAHTGILCRALALSQATRLYFCYHHYRETMHSE